MQLERVRASHLDGEADAVFGSDGVAGRVGLSKVDAEVGRVHPAAAVGAEPGVFGDLEAQVLPAAQSTRDLRTPTALAFLDKLGALSEAPLNVGQV